MQPKPNRRCTRRGAGFFPLSAAALIVGCQGDPPAMPAQPPVEVGVVDVQPRALTLVLEYPAQLKGVREVEVRARVSGILLERRYDEGAHVEAGEVLFRIDPDPFRAEAARARAALAVEEANLGQARRERDRIVPLYEQNLASLRDRDNALAAFEGAEAAVAAATAALRTADLNLSYTEVRAPISGLTSREVRSEGSLVTAGTESSLLTYIVQAEQLYVDLAVADTDADLVRAALESDHAAHVGVSVADATGRAIAEMGKIEFVSPRVDDATGTVAIRAVLDNPGGVVPGRIVRARIEGVTVPNSLVIPKRAVIHGAQGTYVWTVDGNNQVAPAPVELGALAGNDVAVTAGLSAGSRVVVDGILKVIPGVPVNAVLIADGTARNSGAGRTP
ncbi:MAG TPA: efflux RND transporter periplasmic adaptor subunit [Gammaproteobacteria bacterium]|nr:efflux RND transporter periplasmic adaptor subunit [Gammaproteobacteria bacterium]